MFLGECERLREFLLVVGALGIEPLQRHTLRVPDGVNRTGTLAERFANKNRPSIEFGKVCCRGK